ncbi:adenylate/guanylate cyclase [Nitzschia inconspicua]|uniref:Adenylate/guanylate cyclase n=1 Tax=Nitzschia inconspicua TaxID=303405 RepID=A0A9K3LRZ4_9STRA|nr:adenylate/guanylate cyclase [Nitzschia inconspicua]
MINARIPTERSRHVDIQHFAIQDWKDAGDIVLCHIPGSINPSDDLTKPLGWVLHQHHARRLMGHHDLVLPPSSSVLSCNSKSKDLKSGEGVSTTTDDNDSENKIEGKIEEEEEQEEEDEEEQEEEEEQEQELDQYDGRDYHFSFLEPIFSSFDTAKADILGIALAVIHWDDYFTGILESDAKGVIMDLEYSCKDSQVSDPYEYEVSDEEGDVLFLGYNVTHNPKYFHMSERQSISTLSSELEDFHDNDRRGLKDADDKSDSDEKRSLSMTHSVVGIFFFTALIFLLYDCLVQRRNQRVMKTAQQSNAIVLSLFPKNVVAQMMEEANYESLIRSQATQKAFKSFNTSESSGSISGSPMNGGKLIVDTTILFAAIAGFTAWSSMRDPGQVFTLLETIFNAFDKIADRRKVFKVEPVGDCYVAVCGLPDPSKDHALIMASFARDCLTKMGQLTTQLECDLGPDTSVLNMQIGLHSGPVMAGGLLGHHARFQLFGDTVNKASRIETSGLPDDGTSITDLISDASTLNFSSHHGDFASLVSPLISKNLKVRKTSLVRWHKEVLSMILKKIIALRERNLGGESVMVNEAELSQAETAAVCGNATPGHCIEFPVIDVPVEGKDIQLDKVVEEQLGKYVIDIADTYNPNPFHNVEHTCHVALSVTKLLSHMESSSQLSLDDPTTQFVVILTALIHYADHPGVGNQQLVKEEHQLSNMYYPASIAERHSLELVWQLLHQDCYHQLRRAIYSTVAEFEHFRQLLVHSVLVNNIMDKELQNERKDQWEKVFQNDTSNLTAAEQKNLINLQKTAVLETVIQVSDVSHTMQHWKVYQKWNHRLFCEPRKAFPGRQGRKGSQ